MTTTGLDAETLDLFGRTVRSVLAGPGDRTAALVECGWRDVLAADAAVAVPLVFGLQGELCARTSALDDVALAGRDSRGDPADGDAASLGTGSFVHPAPVRAVAARERGDVLEVDGLVLREPDHGVATLTAVLDGRPVVLVVPTGALTTTAVAGLDPTLALMRVRGEVPVALVEHLDDAPSVEVVAACRRALASELAGLAAAMLASTAAYAGERVQFGQPIGAFQAVKHRLADVLVATQGARVAADESWLVDPGDDGALAAAVAKCLAGRAARLASDNCLQVMGAIGFALEHDLHHFMARAAVLDRLYGSARELRVEVGRSLLARGRMARVGNP